MIEAGCAKADTETGTFSKRKIRTAEHVIADLSYNYLERKVLQRGPWLDAPRNDYGIDATMFHHNQRGEVENGEVRFQLKRQTT